MKRVFSESTVKGYQLFRYQGRRADGSPVVYPVFYIRHNSKEIRAETDILHVAQLKIKRQAGEEAHESRKRASEIDTRVGALLDLVVEDYIAAGRNAKDVKSKIDCGLRPYFGTKIANAVDSDEIVKWMKWRRAKLATIQPATINRELALLRRAFKLGYDRSPRLVDRIPPIKMLGVQNTRKGFVSPEQYRALMAELPEHLRPITCIAFHVGNRKGELLNLEWDDVDLGGNPPIFTLWAGETKNKDGRTLPILEGEMIDTLRTLKRERDAKWSQQKHVFVNEGGESLLASAIRKAWASACIRAGQPGLLFHDLRRSGVRNLKRAGVSTSVAMKFSGHKTEAVFRRYDITDFDDLRDAAAKLGKYLAPAPPKDKGERASKRHASK
jgi:integrase